MRSVCFKNLHYQGVVWPPPRAWPSNSAQHFGSPCLLGIFYEIMRFENFFLKFWARLEIFWFECLIFCYGLKFLKLHKGAACAQLVRARAQLVRRLCAEGRSLCVAGARKGAACAHKGAACAHKGAACARKGAACAQLVRSMCAASTPFRSTFAADARL